MECQLESARGNTQPADDPLIECCSYFFRWNRDSMSHSWWVSRWLFKQIERKHEWIRLALFSLLILFSFSVFPLSSPSSSSSSWSLHDHQFSLIFASYCCRAAFLRLLLLLLGKRRTTQTKKKKNREAEGEDNIFDWLMIWKAANHSELCDDWLSSPFSSPIRLNFTLDDDDRDATIYLDRISVIRSWLRRATCYQ